MELEWAVQRKAGPDSDWDQPDTLEVITRWDMLSRQFTRAEAEEYAGRNPDTHRPVCREVTEWMRVE